MSKLRRGRSETPAGSERPLLARILDTPHLAAAVPRLQPEVLHRVIQTCGLEDCTELVALATPQQLSRVFDLDLWRSTRPGSEEQLDADRFGVWLEVLIEAGPSVAAEKVAGLDIDLVITALAQHLTVFDMGTASPYMTTDGIEVTPPRRSRGGVSYEIGGYSIETKRNESIDAIVELLLALNSDHADYFHRVMAGCRRLSNDDFEIDHLHDLLSDVDQELFDLSTGRERRREQRGYVSPGQAVAFLQMARQLELDRETMPARNPIAAAYLRALASAELPQPEVSSDSPGSGAALDPPADASADAVSAVMELLAAEGVLTGQPRALLEAPQQPSSPLARLHAQMAFVSDANPAAFFKRTGELAYLANTLTAGCSLQGRAFTPTEASDAAAAICNLGLENWPRRWLPEQPAGDAAANGATTGVDFLCEHNLVDVFQVGWSILYRDVVMYCAERLLAVLKDLRCSDRDIQQGLNDLRFDLVRAWRDGKPWRLCQSLDAVAVLDLPAWAALVGLIDQCPVIHEAVHASRRSGLRAINPTAFSFISNNEDIRVVRTFLQDLSEILSR